MKDKLIKEAGFSTTYERDRLEALIDLTLNEVFNVLEDPRIINQCVGTTFDASLAGCVVEKVTEEICKRFNFKKVTGVKK